MMPLAYDHVYTWGVRDYSRNGPVLTVREPVTLCYTKPMEKVNFCHVRDANPYFHFFESLWMLAGRQDVATVAHFVPRMADYSDDNVVFNAPYGYRIRQHWGQDQLKEVITHLQQEPQSRQAVVQIWDPRDLNKNTKDRACNMQLVFRIVEGSLNMTIFNRSNDAIWGGVSGANITNLPIFQEYVASYLNLPVGKVYVVSNNLHVYLENPKTQPLLDMYTGKHPPLFSPDEYAAGEVWPDPLITDKEAFDSELSSFMNQLHFAICNAHRLAEGSFNRNNIFPNVAVPMLASWTAHKQKDQISALNWAKEIEALDWRLACINWLERRYNAKS